MKDEPTGDDHGSRMSQSDATSLWTLRVHWEGRYHIALVDGVWRAKRCNDVTKVLTAGTSTELRTAMQNDYAAWMSAERRGGS